MKSINTLIGVIFFAIFLMTSTLFAWQEDFPTYESYLDYLGNYPEARETDWSDQAQGITNDGSHWYITQKTKLIRAPETADLNQDLYDYGYTRIEEWPALSGYDHFGDISFYDPDPNDSIAGYILVPVDSGPEDALLALFKADESLSFVDADFFKDQGTNAGWVAVGQDGTVYSSENSTTEIRKYSVNWEQVKNNGLLEVTFEKKIPLLDRDGITTCTLTRMQGGVVTPSGSMLFLSNGFWTGEEGDDSWGLHAFLLNSNTCIRIARSCKEDCLFTYRFLPGGLNSEEPEGLTIWDQDFGKTPNLDGQLHVFMLDTKGDTNDIYLKHYTFRQFLKPGDDIQQIHDNAWSGSVMSFEAGEYNQSATFNKKIILESRGGTAVIGGN